MNILKTYIAATDQTINLISRIIEVAKTITKQYLFGYNIHITKSSTHMDARVENLHVILLKVKKVV